MSQLQRPNSNIVDLVAGRLTDLLAEVWTRILSDFSTSNVVLSTDNRGPRRTVDVRVSTQTWRVTASNAPTDLTQGSSVCRQLNTD